MDNAYLDENYLTRREGLFRVRLTARTTVSGKYVYSGYEVIPDPTALAGLAVANPGRSFDPTACPLFEINNTEVSVSGEPIVWARLRSSEGGVPSYEFDGSGGIAELTVTKRTNTNRSISYSLTGASSVDGQFYVDFTDGIAIHEYQDRPYLRLLVANSDNTLQRSELQRDRGIIDAYEAEWAGIKQFRARPVMQSGLVVGNLVTTGQAQPRLTITGITNANPGVVTTSASHGLAEDDDVLLYSVTGISLDPFYRVGAPVTATTFTLKNVASSTLLDTTSLGTFTGGYVIDCSWQPDPARGIQAGVEFRPSDYDNNTIGTNGAQLWLEPYVGNTKLAALGFGSNSNGHAIVLGVDSIIGDAAGSFELLMSSVHDASLATTTLGIYCDGSSIGMVVSSGGCHFFCNPTGSLLLTGSTGSFTTVDGKTVTVTGGIITSIV